MILPFVLSAFLQDPPAGAVPETTPKARSGSARRPERAIGLESREAQSAISDGKIPLPAGSESAPTGRMAAWTVAVFVFLGAFLYALRRWSLRGSKLGAPGRTTLA